MRHRRLCLAGIQILTPLMALALMVPETVFVSPLEAGQPGETHSVAGGLPSEDYMLLSKKGATWTYIVGVHQRGAESRGTMEIRNAGPAYFEGQRVVRIIKRFSLVPLRNVDEYYLSTKEGVFFAGMEVETRRRGLFMKGVAQPHALVFKNNAGTNEKWENKGELITSGPSESVQTELPSEVSFEGRDNVRAMGGEHEALKIRMLYPRMAMVETNWLVKGIGMVKWVIKSASGDFHLEAELQRYSLPE